MAHQTKRKSLESKHSGLNKWLVDNTDCPPSSLYHGLEVVKLETLQQLRTCIDFKKSHGSRLLKETMGLRIEVEDLKIKNAKLTEIVNIMRKNREFYLKLRKNSCILGLELKNIKDG